MRHPAPSVSRARWLLMGLFALTGITFSSWLARIPTVRDLLDLSTSELGLHAARSAPSAPCSRSPCRASSCSASAAASGSSRRPVCSRPALVLMGVGPTVGSVALLGVGIFLNGVAVALGNVPLNVESARIERAMGRTVIPQFHAAFSIGAVDGLGARRHRVAPRHLGRGAVHGGRRARRGLAAGVPARPRPARRAGRPAAHPEPGGRRHASRSADAAASPPRWTPGASPARC